MDKNKAMLALDAAIVAVINTQAMPSNEKVLNEISNEIGEIFSRKYPEFGAFLAAQKAAVVALSQDAGVFGEPTR